MEKELRPLIGVVMACYNDELYIGEAIESILKQTYENWELVIVDDASTDSSVDVIAKYLNEKVKLIINENNSGLAFSLNRGIEAVKSAKFIARMDSDDIAYSTRFEEQVNYLLEHNEVSVVGSNIELFNETGVFYKSKDGEFSDQLMAQIPFGSPLSHSTWMINLEKFSGEFKYNELFRSSQDYELMYRLFCDGYKIACIKKPLLKYRVRNNSISHKTRVVDPNTLVIQRKVAGLFGIDDSEKKVRPINFCKDDENHSIRSFLDMMMYCLRLLKQNRRLNKVSQGSLRYYCIRLIYGSMRKMVSIKKTD